MFQWETHVSLGVLLVLIIVIIVPRSVFTKSSSIKLYKEDKRLLFNSDPWPPAEQKLEMPCDNYITNKSVDLVSNCYTGVCLFSYLVCKFLCALIAFLIVLQWKCKNLLGEKQPNFTKRSTPLGN